MHERILVIGKENITADEFLICFPWFIGSTADYVTDFDEPVEEELRSLAAMKRPGVSIDPENKSISLANSEDYFGGILEAFKYSVVFANTTEEDRTTPAYEKWCEVLTKSKMAIDILDDKFGIYVVYEGELFTINEFFHYVVRYKKETTFKVANILDYHF